jgi:non-ribosomal peptide synthetase component F
MERSDCFTDMNKVHVRTETTRKEKLATWWQYMEEQFKALSDQFEAFLTQLSNMGGHNEHHHQPSPHIWEEEDKHDNGYKFGIPFAVPRT